MNATNRIGQPFPTTNCRPGETVLTKVQFHNLDFSGTPFEHRYNENSFKRMCHIENGENLAELAEQEPARRSPIPKDIRECGEILTTRWFAICVHILKVGK